MQNDELDINDLEKISIRLPHGILTSMKKIAELRGMKYSEYIRNLLIKRHFEDIQASIFIEPKDAVKDRELKSQILTSSEAVRRELNRIGVNYNQEIKVLNISKKESRSKTFEELEAEAMGLQDDNKKSQSSALDVDAVTKIINKHIITSRKVVDDIWLTRK